MVKRTKRGAGLMPAAVAEIRRIREEWAALKHSDLLATPDSVQEKRVLKPLNYNIQAPPTINNKSTKAKAAMSLSKPINSDILVGVVALVEVGNEYRALALRAALSALGASIVPNWSALVTHVVWGEGGSCLVRKNARTYAAKLVSPLWVEACVTANEWLPERAFPTATRDSDLPSPRTVLRLLREAEGRKVPIQLILTGLTASDGGRSSEPGASDAAAMRIEPGTDGNGTANTQSRAGAETELNLTNSQSTETKKTGVHGTPAEQTVSNRPDALVEKDALDDQKEAIRTARNTTKPKHPFEENLTSLAGATQCGNADDNGNPSDGPGPSGIRSRPARDRSNESPSCSDWKVFGAPRQDGRPNQHCPFSSDDDETLPVDPADRLGAKPKIRPPPKQKKPKKKKPEKDTPPINASTSTDDYATDDISNVNTLPRRVLPASLSPSPPMSLRHRRRYRSPPQPPTRTPTPPLHGHRRCDGESSSSMSFRSISPVGTGSASRSPTPPLHGHRRCRPVPQPPPRAPKERYKSPSPGPSRAPHVPPRPIRSPSPQRRSPVGLSRTKSPSPGPSKGKLSKVCNQKPTLRVPPLALQGPNGDNKAPIRKPPRPRSSSVPRARSANQKPLSAKKANTRRMLFVHRLFDDCQSDDIEQHSDPEPDTDETVTWGQYWAHRRRDEMKINQLERSKIFPRDNYQCARILQRTLMKVANNNAAEDSDTEDEPDFSLHQAVAVPDTVRPDVVSSPRHERKALARAERTARRLIGRPGTPTMERSSSPILYSLRPRIVLTGMSTEERIRVTDACTQLGGRIQNRVNKNTTHVLVGSFGSFGIENNTAGIVTVPDASLPRPITVRLRTVNALAGAARGCRVLRAQWAFDSSATDAWITHHRYQIPYLKALCEKAAAERHAFGLTRADYAYDVFNGRRVIISEECDQREAVVELLALCGAVIYDHEGHIIRNQETKQRLDVNRSIHIGHDGEIVKLIPPRTGRTESGDWARSHLEHSGDVIIGTRPGQVIPRWVFDSVASSRMRSLHRYIIPQNG